MKRLAPLLCLLACGELDKDSATATATGPTIPTGGTAAGTPTTSCELGLACNPIPVASFPYTDSRSTVDAPGSEVDRYACAADTDESGPEWFYAITAPSAGIVSVTVDDAAGDNIDVDVHLLASTDPDTCLNRDNQRTSWVVEAGSTTIATVDTWVNGNGDALSGAYTLTVDFFPLDSGPCATVPTEVRMFWPECGAGHDCAVATHTDGVDYPFLHTPSVGPLVKEAHLVSTVDDFGGGWPDSFTDQIHTHYALTTTASGYTMPRVEPWAPAGEGGSNFGQGSTGTPVPPEHETWYVNMYWRDRPAKGHRMILFNPNSGAAVVVAAGYETGPGSNTAIGGATEEAHHVLGTVHRSEVVMAFAADQGLPFGPIDCF